MTSHANSPIIAKYPEFGEGIVLNAHRPQRMRRILGIVVLVLTLAGVLFAATSIEAVVHLPVVIADQTVDTISAHIQLESMHPSSG
jgi:hypothetical protein